MKVNISLVSITARYSFNNWLISASNSSFFASPTCVNRMRPCLSISSVTGSFSPSTLNASGTGFIAERDRVIHRVIFKKRLYLCRAFFIKRDANDFKTARLVIFDRTG